MECVFRSKITTRLTVPTYTELLAYYGHVSHYYEVARAQAHPPYERLFGRDRTVSLVTPWAAQMTVEEIPAKTRDLGVVPAGLVELIPFVRTLLRSGITNKPLRIVAAGDHLVFGASVFVPVLELLGGRGFLHAHPVTRPFDDSSVFLVTSGP